MEDNQKKILVINRNYQSTLNQEPVINKERKQFYPQNVINKFISHVFDNKGIQQSNSEIR
jgi:hypothetical protein